MRNIALLERVMQQIEDHSELHEQSWYFTQTDCGTAACFAGWACLLSGLTPVSSDMVSLSVGTLRFACGAASELLGLTYDEAEVLFNGDNTRDMLRLMVKDLVNGDQLAEWQEYWHECLDEDARESQ